MYSHIFALHFVSTWQPIWFGEFSYQIQENRAKATYKNLLQVMQDFPQAKGWKWLIKNGCKVWLKLGYEKFCVLCYPTSPNNKNDGFWKHIGNYHQVICVHETLQCNIKLIYKVDFGHRNSIFFYFFWIHTILYIFKTWTPWQES